MDNEKKDISGSNKRFGFALSGQKNAQELHVFEGAIDLLSYITILEQQGIDWRYDDYLSLGNASLLGKSIEKITIPVALEEYLSSHTDIKSLHLHLDNDQAGHDTTEKIKYTLKERYQILDKTPRHHNDINKVLQKRLRYKKQQQFNERI